MPKKENLAEQILVKILQQCYVSYSHGRQHLLVIDGIIDWSSEEDRYIEKLQKKYGEEK